MNYTLLFILTVLIISSSSFAFAQYLDNVSITESESLLTVQTDRELYTTGDGDIVTISGTVSEILYYPGDNVPFILTVEVNGFTFTGLMILHPTPEGYYEATIDLGIGNGASTYKSGIYTVDVVYGHLTVSTSFEVRNTEIILLYIDDKYSMKFTNMAYEYFEPFLLWDFEFLEEKTHGQEYLDLNLQVNDNINLAMILTDKSIYEILLENGQIRELDGTDPNEYPIFAYNSCVIFNSTFEELEDKYKITLAVVCTIDISY